MTPRVISTAPRMLIQLIFSSSSSQPTTVGGSTKSRYAYGMGLTLRGEQVGKTVLRKTGQATYTISANNNINGGSTVDTTLFFGGTEGTGLYVSDLSIENASTGECYAIYATRARCVLERLNVCTNSHGIYLYGWLNNLTDIIITAKEKGLLRSEGKDYVVKDGDMIYFRFNV